MVLHLMEHFIAGSTLLTVEALVSLLREKILFLFDRHNLSSRKEMLHLGSC